MAAAAVPDVAEAVQEGARTTVQGMAWGARAGHLSLGRDLQIDASGSLRQRAGRGYRNVSSIKTDLEASMMSLGSYGADDGEVKFGADGSGGLGGGQHGPDAGHARGAAASGAVSGGPRLSAFDTRHLQTGPMGAGVAGGEGATSRSTSDSVPSLARLGLSNASERLKRLKTQRERSARITRQLRDAQWKDKPIEVVGGGVQAAPGPRDRRPG